MKVRSMYNVPSTSIHGDTVTQWRLFREEDFLSTIIGFVANIVAPGVTVEPHEHENIEHVYFVLSGVGVIRIGDEEQEVSEGDAIYMPPRLPHSLRNTGTYPLRFVVASAKGK